MSTGFLHLHSALRYLVLLAGVVAVLSALYSVVKRRPYDKSVRGSSAAFAGLMHLQVLIGFFLLVSGRFHPQLIGHIFLMLAAAAAAQVPLSVLRRRVPEERHPMPHLVGNGVALVLIWAGILAIGRGILEATFF